MKKIIVSIVMVLVLVLGVSLCIAQVKEPEEFMGMKWGQTIKEFKEKGMIDEGLSSPPKEIGNCIQFANDDRIGDISPVLILFRFNDGKFSESYISFKNHDHFQAFKRALSEKYGKPTDEEEMKNSKNDIIVQKYKWDFENVRQIFNSCKKIVLLNQRHRYPQKVLGTTFCSLIIE